MTRELGKAKLKCFRHPRKRFTWYEYGNGDQYMECNKCHLRIEFDYAGKIAIYDNKNILSTWSIAEQFEHAEEIINERGLNKVVTHPSDNTNSNETETQESETQNQIFQEGHKLAHETQG